MLINVFGISWRSLWRFHCSGNPCTATLFDDATNDFPVFTVPHYGKLMPESSLQGTNLSICGSCATICFSTHRHVPSKVSARAATRHQSLPITSIVQPLDRSKVDKSIAAENSLTRAPMHLHAQLLCSIVVLHVPMGQRHSLRVIMTRHLYSFAHVPSSLPLGSHTLQRIRWSNPLQQSIPISPLSNQSKKVS